MGRHPDLHFGARCLAAYLFITTPGSQSVGGGHHVADRSTISSGESPGRVARELGARGHAAQSASAAQIDGTEDKDIVLKFGTREMPFKGEQFLVGFTLPNFYFHYTTAYDILRSLGVEIGKRDFMGPPGA